MKKLTAEELTQVQELRSSLFGIISSVGELHLNKVLLQNQLNDINQQLEHQEEKFAEFQKQEKVIYEQLQEKYGTGNINIDTGEITE